MSWVTISIIAALFFGLSDLLTKLLGRNIHILLSSFLLTITSAFAIGVYLIYMKLFKNEVLFLNKKGIIISGLIGLIIAVATILFILAFSKADKLSAVSPLIRSLTIIIASLLGILFLKEKFTLKYIIGLILCIVGIYLITTK